MIGAIIGDIVGSRFEFNNNLYNYDFELFTDECSITDDTVCTIAIADALLSRRDYKSSLLKWCSIPFEFKNGGYGASFYAWIFSEVPKPYNSYGNGSAMRVSPVALLCAPREVASEAIASALPTHNHPEGIKGALVTALAIKGLFETKRKGVLYSLERAYYDPFKKYPRGYYDITCQGTVPVALRIVANSISFEDALRNAILWGGDSDTLAAIVGPMAEALFGIPDTIKEQVMPFIPEEMHPIVSRLYQTK